MLRHESVGNRANHKTTKHFDEGGFFVFNPSLEIAAGCIFPPYNGKTATRTHPISENRAPNWVENDPIVGQDSGQALSQA